MEPPRRPINTHFGYAITLVRLQWNPTGCSAILLLKQTFMVTCNYISGNSHISKFLGLQHRQAPVISTLLPRVKERDAPGCTAVIEEIRQRCVHVAEACSYFIHTEAGDDILTCFGYFLKYDINFDN